MMGWATIAMMTTFSACTGASEAGTDGPSDALATPFEAEVIGPLLAEARAGVRPYDDQGIGVCRGTHDCDEWLGREVTEPLPPGEYGLYAALRVPPVGPPGTWRLAVTVTCTGEGADAAPYTREHDLHAPPGRTVRPFRIVLQRITSPGPDGPRQCRWQATAPHPDHPTTWEGGWSTP